MITDIFLLQKALIFFQQVAMQMLYIKEAILIFQLQPEDLYSSWTEFCEIYELCNEHSK